MMLTVIILCIDSRDRPFCISRQLVSVDEMKTQQGVTLNPGWWGALKARMLDTECQRLPGIPRLERSDRHARIEPV